jgi:hypothetical protein
MMIRTIEAAAFPAGFLSLAGSQSREVGGKGGKGAGKKTPSKTTGKTGKGGKK